MSDSVTRRLSDRELATVIDALQIAREKIKANGGSGDDCQSALDQLYDGIVPNTNGLTYMLGQHPSLVDVSEDGWLTRLDDCTDVNGHLSRATDHITSAVALLQLMDDRAWQEHRNDDHTNLIEQMTELRLAGRIVATSITA